MIQEKPAVFQFSTEALPEEERLAVWREVIGRTVAKTDFEPLPGTRFSQTATLRSMPGLTIVTGTGNGYRAERTAALLAGSSDDFYLLVHAEGESQVSQLGREISFGSGEALLLSGTDVASKLVWEPLRYIVIGVPREALRARLKNPETALMKQIPGSNEALRVLVSYLSAVNRGDPPLIGAESGPLLPPLFATHVYDLMAMAIAATRDEGPEAEGPRLARRPPASHQGRHRPQSRPPRLVRCQRRRPAWRQPALRAHAVRGRRRHLFRVRAQPAAALCASHAERAAPCQPHHRLHRFRSWIFGPVAFQPGVPAAL